MGMISADYHGCTKSGQPLYVIRAGISNPTALMNEMDRDVIIDWMLYKKEAGFKICDDLTRKTRVLTKVITVNDLNHVTISSLEKRFQMVMSAVSKLSEKYYPQFLGKAIMINIPYFFYSVWSAIKPLMSAKTRAKVAIYPGNTLKDDIDTCFGEFAKQLELNTLPSFAGGQCICKPGCINNVPNDQCRMVSRLGD